jgi:hypothetical protein
MPLPKPKSPNRIEVWRKEVSASTTSFTPTEAEYIAPVIRQPSFWKKVLKKRSRPSIRVEETKREGQNVRTEMYDGREKGEGDAGLRVPGNGDGERERSRGGSSMEICSVESEMDGLKEKRERLERAARLLNGEAKKEGGRRKQDDGGDHGKSLGGGHS